MPGEQKPQPAPDQAVGAFVEAINAGSLEVATSCLARDACLVTAGSTAIHGRDEIRSVLGQMIEARTKIAVDLGTVLRTGEVALVRQRWALRPGVGAGSGFQEPITAAIIVRWLEAGWKIVLVLPWG